MWWRGVQPLGGTDNGGQSGFWSVRQKADGGVVVRVMGSATVMLDLPRVTGWNPANDSDPVRDNHEGFVREKGRLRP